MLYEVITLRIIAGLESPDTGEVAANSAFAFEYLEQLPAFEREQQVLDAVMDGVITSYSIHYTKLYDSAVLLCRRVLLEEIHRRCESRAELADVEFFVGGMQIIIGQSEAEKNGVDTEQLLKIGDHGDGSAFTRVKRIFLVDLV